ncbi:MAG: CpsD/CapB family tyrosine-protein kinase [candidate division Zixibacteria bacterium]|nr:CpsD/CapB family tyrosine-protein kinase [candidate division Zixibacteria bacterium]
MARKRLSIIEHYSAESPFATEFRRLLQKVRSSGAGPELKSLLVTSAMLSEGKSTISAMFAIAAAVHQGLKTLVIDCDLHRPVVHSLFRVDRQPGLAEILVEGFSPMGAVTKTRIDKLDLLTAGGHCENPAAVFDPESIGGLIDELKFYYDLIVIDSPPIIPVSDPMLLASKVDGILLVLKAGSTQKEVAKRAVNIISGNEHKILGVVLNNVDNSLPYYYDYSYYGYAYNQKSSRIPLSTRGRDNGKKKKAGGKDRNIEQKI